MVGPHAPVQGKRALIARLQRQQNVFQDGEAQEEIGDLEGARGQA